MPKVTGQVKTGDRWADEQRERKQMDTSKTNKQDMNVMLTYYFIHYSWMCLHVHIQRYVKNQSQATI